jgi:DMSO/TMAO reductase YedYZ molybdopterin-dependent catalytic subunit
MFRIRLMLALAACACALLVGGHGLRAQEAPYSGAFTIDGLVAHQLTFTPRDLAWLPVTQLTGQCADGSQHTYAGIDLAGVLAAAGLQNADPLQSYVEVSGAGGTRVLIAWGEIDRLALTHPLAGPVLALVLDGEAIGRNGGAVRLVWDGCPSARDVPAVQRITVGTLADAPSSTLLAAQADDATGLAQAALSDADLPGLVPQYIGLANGSPSDQLPHAVYRGYWAAPDATTRALVSLRTYATADTVSAGYQLTLALLSQTFACAAQGNQDLGSLGIGDEDHLMSWSCPDFLGSPATFSASVFRRGRIVAAVVAIQAQGDTTDTVTGWARALDAKLAALAQ